MLQYPKRIFWKFNKPLRQYRKTIFGDVYKRQTGINPDTRVKDLTLDEEAKIRDYIDQANILVEGDLRRNVALDIKRLVEIQSFRGTRHRKNLPCRGQRTKTNARTCKGPKRTVANKKK